MGISIVCVCQSMKEHARSEIMYGYAVTYEVIWKLFLLMNPLFMKIRGEYFLAWLKSIIYFKSYIILYHPNIILWYIAICKRTQAEMNY